MKFLEIYWIVLLVAVTAISLWFCYDHEDYIYLIFPLVPAYMLYRRRSQRKKEKDF